MTRRNRDYNDPVGAVFLIALGTLALAVVGSFAVVVVMSAVGAI